MVCRFGVRRCVAGCLRCILGFGFGLWGDLDLWVEVSVGFMLWWWGFGLSWVVGVYYVVSSGLSLYFFADLVVCGFWRFVGFLFCGLCCSFWL